MVNKGHLLRLSSGLQAAAAYLRLLSDAIAPAAVDALRGREKNPDDTNDDGMAIIVIPAHLESIESTPRRFRDLSEIPLPSLLWHDLYVDWSVVALRRRIRVFPSSFDRGW